MKSYYEVAVSIILVGCVEFLAEFCVSTINQIMTEAAALARTSGEELVAMNNIRPCTLEVIRVAHNIEIPMPSGASILVRLLEVLVLVT
jgi:hypothetical protein